MKSLIIENQWEVDEDLQEFVDTHPDLVGEVTTYCHALERGTEALGGLIAQHDQLLMESTFMYKDQLETILHALHAGKLGSRPRRVGCIRLLSKIDEWTEPYKPYKNSYTILEDGTRVPDPERPGEYSYSAKSGFEDHKLFLEHLIELVESERLELYDITGDYRVRVKATGQLMYFDTAKAQGLTRDDVEWMRDEDKTMLRIRYNRELRRFHYENTEPDPDAYRY